MELKDVELLKVLQRSQMAAPKPIVAEVKVEGRLPVRPEAECKPVWNGEN